MVAVVGTSWLTVDVLDSRTLTNIFGLYRVLNIIPGQRMLLSLPHYLKVPINYPRSLSLSIIFLAALQFC